MIFPVLILVLIGAASFGIGLYQANLASGAIQQPALKKLEMADTPGPISQGKVLGWVTGEGTKGSMLTGKAVDSVAFVDNDPNIALVVGTKDYKGIASFVPGMTITVAQGLNKNLLLAADAGGAKRRPVGSPWVPGGAPRTPPWQNPVLGQDVPPDLKLNPGCAQTPVGDDVVNGLNTDSGNPKTYISRDPFATFSPVDKGQLMEMAQSFDGACASAGAGVCAQEEKDLEPKPPKDQPALPDEKYGTPPGPVSYSFKATNPPGGPGTILTYGFVCKAPDGKTPVCDPPQLQQVTPNPAVGPNHGMYTDPTGKYEKPPADFVKSCMARKQAECMVKKAVDKANSILSAYPDACK